MASNEAESVMEALMPRCGGMYCKGAGHAAVPEHMCPYSIDIENDHIFRCQCCETCQAGCGDEC